MFEFPVPLVTGRRGEGLQVHPEGLGALAALPGTIPVVISGKSSSLEKSAFLQKLFSIEKYYEQLAGGQEPGLWLWGETALGNAGSSAIVIDHHRPEGAVGEPEDMQLLILSFLLCSHFFYFHNGAVKQSTFLGLTCLPKTFADISSDAVDGSSTPTALQSAAALDNLLPRMSWFFYNLFLPSGDQNEAKDYLQNALKEEAIVSEVDDFKVADLRLKNTVKKVLSSVQYDAAVDNEPLEGSIFRAHFLQTLMDSSPKVFEGIVFNASSLGALLPLLLPQLAQGITPDLFGACEKLEEERYAPSSREGLALYTSLIRDALQEGPPLSIDEFEIHDKQNRDIALDMLSGPAHGKDTGKAIKGARRKLKKLIAEERQRAFEALRMRSRDWCMQVRVELLLNLRHKAQNGQIRSLKEFKQDLDDFCQAYRRRAAGPQAEQVLLECLCNEIFELFQIFEEKCYDRLKEEKLEEAIWQEREKWDRKRENLAKELEQEQGRLRETVEHEKLTFKRLSEVARSRMKASTAEIRSLRKEIEEYRGRLEHSEQERRTLIERSQAAEHRVKEMNDRWQALNEALQGERAISQELEERLITLIARLEARETDFEVQSHRYKESTMELQAVHQKELSRYYSQVKTLSEERDELQRRLSDFFIKVTNLPVQMQQQFFLAEDDVGFVDALSGYMDE